MNAYLIGLLVLCAITLSLVIWVNIYQARDKAENKSGSSDYIYHRNENTSVIGGTNLDRFFIECVLSGCTDFSKEKNVSKAKLLADKYNLSYASGIDALYKESMNAHEKISGKLLNDKLAQKRSEEKSEYDKLNKYAELYGKDKTRAMLTDRMNELRSQASSMEKSAQLISRMGQQQERNWAVWGGIANGLGGVGAGLATALDVQAQNAQIRAQNEANMRATLPAYMSFSSNASQNRSNAAAIQKEIETLNEKLLSEASSAKVMALLEVVNPTIDISETGAYKITATIQVKQELFIFDDVPATADGTVLAHVYDGSREIGTAKMVLPVYGVSSKTGIVGVGLSGAEQGKAYRISFSEYKLWLMERKTF